MTNHMFLQLKKKTRKLHFAKPARSTMVKHLSWERSKDRSEWPNKRLMGQFPVVEIIDCWSSEVIGGTDLKIKLSVDLTVGM